MSSHATAVRCSRRRCADIEEQRSRRIRDVAAMTADQMVAHEILGQADPADARIGVGLVLAHPEQLWRCEPGKRAVAGEPQQRAFRPLPVPSRILALRRGTLIVPEDCGADHRSARRRGRRARASGPRSRCRESPTSGPRRPCEHVPRGANHASGSCSHPSGVWRAHRIFPLDCRKHLSRRSGSTAMPLADDVPISMPTSAPEP